MTIGLIDDQLGVAGNYSQEAFKDNAVTPVIGSTPPCPYSRIKETSNSSEKTVWFKYDTLEGNLQYERYFSNSYHDKNK